jgi:hypothetical protein
MTVMTTTRTYTVHRTMQDGSTEYLPGSTREMTPADAAELVDIGALSVKGEKPTEREPAVRHTFGSEPSAVNDGGYTIADEGRAITSDKAQPAAAKTTAPKAKA